MMNELHRVFMNLGSNLEPEKHIPEAVKRLGEFGIVEECSSFWETKSVGYDAPNFLNICIRFHTPLALDELKGRAIRPIEAQMGRIRNTEKPAPHAIDIDIVLFDETPLKPETWDEAYVVVPLAELLPELKTHSGEKLSDLAKQAQGRVWMRRRRDVKIRSAEVQRRGQDDPEIPGGY